MRRLVAFIIIVITVFLGIGLVAKESIIKINTGTEFSDSRKVVYRVTDFDNEDEEVDLDSLAKEMTRRLNYAEVNNFSITIEGEHQISAVVPMTTTISYEHYKKLLAFNGNFSLCTTTDVCKESDEIFKNSVAYLKFYEAIPAVVIPISNSSLVEALRIEAEEQEAPAQDEEGNASSFNMQNLILWANKTEEDTFDLAYKGQDDGDGINVKKMREKIIMTFAYDSLYLNDEKTAICAVLNPSRNDNNEFIAKSVQENIVLAKQYVNLLNSGPLDYDVEFLYDQLVPASAGNILTFGENVTISPSQFIVGLLVAYFVSIGFMLLFFRGATVTYATTSLATLVGTLLLFNLFGLEFGVGALVGIATVMGLSLCASIIHLDKIKNELYKGRTVKKATFEASKKMAMPIFDIAIAVILFSLLSYFIGNGMVKSFAIFTIIGAVLNLVFGVLGGKFLIWVLAGDNNSYLQEHKGFFGVYKDKIPDASKEEKQTFFGNFAGRDFTKNKKRVGIITGLVALCGVILCGVFASTSRPFNTEALNNQYTFVQIEVGNKSDIHSYSDVEYAFTTLGIKVSDSTVAQGLNDDDEDIAFFMIKTKSIIDADATITYTYENVEETTNTIEALTKLIQVIDEDAIITINLARTYGADRVDGMTALAALVGLAVAVVYLAVRYGLSKAKIAFLVGAVAVIIPLSLFVILRLAFVPNALLAVLAISIFTLMGSVIYANREKEIHNEAREPLEGHDLVVKTSADIAATYGAVILLAIMVAVAFLAFGPALYTTLFMVLILGLAESYAFVIIFFGDFSLVMKNLTKNLVAMLKKPAKGNKKTKKRRAKPVKNTSAEPEESIFIGIND